MNPGVTVSDVNETQVSMTRAEQIAEDIRMQIVRGELAPGARLPTWGDYERQYHVTRTTLNRVFARLKSEGFVYSSSTSGTFVSEYPPNSFRYAIVFSQTPGSSGWNRFWWTMANQAVVLGQTGNRQFPCFYGVADQVDNEPHADLLSQAKAHRLAGLVLLGNPEISGELRCCADVPKVAVGRAGPEAEIPCVDMDHRDFLVRAVQSMVQSGRRRIAIITTATEPCDEFPQIAKDAGVEHRSYWRLAVSVHHPETVRPIIHLLMSSKPDERPDGIIIADDNLVEETSAALIEGRIRVPDDVEIISHFNWPNPVRSILPGRRLGLDTRRLLEECLTILNAQRRGESVPIQTLVPCVFEDECVDSLRTEIARR